MIFLFCLSGSGILSVNAIFVWLQLDRLRYQCSHNDGGRSLRYFVINVFKCLRPNRFKAPLYQSFPQSRCYLPLALELPVFRQ